MQLDVRDAARMLAVSEKTIYRWIKQGKLPACEVNDQYRFNRSELLEFATANQISPAPEFCAEPSEGGPEPRLDDALKTGGVVYRLPGTDKDSVLRGVVQAMRLPDGVDRQLLLQVLLARESLGSTGIGDGVAIPHVRNPIVLHIDRPIITLCFLAQPIDFAALDGKPVSTLFTLVSPTVRAHIRLLSRIAFALRDTGFQAAIARQAPADDILNEARRVEDSFQVPRAAEQ